MSDLCILLISDFHGGLKQAPIPQALGGDAWLARMSEFFILGSHQRHRSTRSLEYRRRRTVSLAADGAPGNHRILQDWSPRKT